MIRQAFLAAAAVALCGVGVAQAETTFVGYSRATAASSQCRNAHVGDEYVTRFHPFISGQTDRSEGFSLVFQSGGESYVLRNRGFDNAFRTVESGGLGWGGNFTFPTTQWAQIALVGTRPTITASTQVLVLRWQIKRPGGDAGGLACVLAMTGVFLKRP